MVLLCFIFAVPWVCSPGADFCIQACTETDAFPDPTQLFYALRICDKYVLIVKSFRFMESQIIKPVYNRRCLFLEKKQQQQQLCVSTSLGIFLCSVAQIIGL